MAERNADAIKYSSHVKKSSRFLFSSIHIQSEKMLISKSSNFSYYFLLINHTFLQKHMVRELNKQPKAQFGKGDVKKFPL